MRNLLVKLLLLQLALSQALPSQRDRLRGHVHFAIAAPPSAQSYGRAFNRTLASITQNYLASRVDGFSINVTVSTVSIELPENGSFSAQLLESVCEKFQGKRVVVVLIVGNSPAALTVSIAAKHAGIGVLWARGSSHFLPEFRSMESSSLEVHLAPNGGELVHALRSLLLQAHWHSFTVLADRASATALQRPELWRALGATPLHPTLVALPSPLRQQTLFRKLADISRSTRGVVVLMSDRTSSVRILEEAKRLNMMDGHFVWLWIDTAAAIHIKNSTTDEPPDPEPRSKRSIPDYDDLHTHYLLQNDKNLMLNRPDDLEPWWMASPRSSKRGSRAVAQNLSELPAGLLSMRSLAVRVDRHLVKGAVRLLGATLKHVMLRASERALRDTVDGGTEGCWVNKARENGFVSEFIRELKKACTNALAGKRYSQEIGVDKVDKSLVANFEILNLVPEPFVYSNKTDMVENPKPPPSVSKWKRVGMVSGRSVRLDTIVWPGGDLSVAAVSSRARTVFRIVTALAPPFVMASDIDENGQCFRGILCHRVLTSDKDNLTLVFNEMQHLEEEENEAEEEAQKNRYYEDYKFLFGDYPGEEEEGERFLPFKKFKYQTNCCYGLSMDLLVNIAEELEFDYHLYIAADGLFGSRIKKGANRTARDVGKKFLSYRLKNDRLKSARSYKGYNQEDAEWNGIVGDLISGAAHMSFAPLSVSSARSQVIDFSVPYFFSGVSFLAAPQQKSEVPLMAFLLPFSTELWIAIFTSLNITAIAVAIYEWLSPFGLNPWGRQRSKNFSMSSALWVMWGLLCGHLVAFKAPKSWPNKFLINVWGGFSVIFVASYTANIAALIAGLFFNDTFSDYHDRSLLVQRVGAPKSSAAEYYVQKADLMLWEHVRKFSLGSIEEGVERLRNGTLDILIADTPILDYYRGTDQGCKLQKIGVNAINQDTYAIGMAKGFPLKDSISAVIAKYSSNGYLDILQEKWYGSLPCFKLETEIAQPRPLGVAAVTGVFILLGVGIALGLLILVVEHLFFRYTLPMLRNQPKGSIWHSRNIMFFSQKLYRFINCVELVSPHHAARELVHTIRQGQITSLFQKSIKRKEHEQRRRRKSKAQFFEMIQEIRSVLRRQQQEEREPPLAPLAEVDSEYQLSPDGKKLKLSPSIIRRTFLRSSPRPEKTRSPYFNKQLFSPRSKTKAKSSSNLNVRRFSTDSVFSAHTQPSAVIGRRLSKDASAFLSSSPPDINSRRSSYLDIISSGSKLAGKSPILSIENLSDCSKYSEPMRKLSDSESIGKKLATLPRYQEAVDKHRLQPQYSLTLGKSDETLSKSASEARSFNVSSNLSDDEIAKRNKKTISQLHNTLGQNLKRSNKPQIRIQVEDTTQPRHPPLSKTRKTRHQSLGDETQEQPDAKPDHSKSLDAPAPKQRSRSRSGELPPAPPPPNCSPRNSNGRSPLERLSKEELVLLWRSSESELRSHLLKALRNKEEPEPP